MSDIAIPPFPIEIGGVAYTAEFAEVESFFLGTEDHGIFTAVVTFKGPGWGQALPPRDLSGKFGLEFIKALVHTIGSPDQAKGTRVAVFRKEGGRSTFIEGFAPVKANGTLGTPFIAQDIVDKYGDQT